MGTLAAAPADRAAGRASVHPAYPLRRAPAVEELAQLFGDPLLASAAMDRLLQHAHPLVLEGDSYRNPPPAKRRASQNGTLAEGAR